jgi:U11/U12 small nuclear ribonucleoprotein SNRNP31
MLGECEPPKKKEKKKVPEPEEEIEAVEESEDKGEDPALDSLRQAIAFQQAKTEEEQNKWEPDTGGPSTSGDSRHSRIRRVSTSVMRKSLVVKVVFVTEIFLK